MDITQNNLQSVALRQTLNQAATNSPSPTVDNGVTNQQESSKIRLVAERAVRAEDIPKNAAQHNENLLPSDAGHVLEGSIEFHYLIGEIEKRITDSFQVELDIMNANFHMYESRKSFKAEASAVFPELSSKDFGLSVDANGDLMILNNRGKLTGEQHSQLTSLLQNSSHYSTLKRYANDIMDASIRWTEAKNGTETMDSFHDGGVNLILNKQNFHKTYDFFSEKSTLDLLNSAPKELHTHKVTVYKSGQWVDVRV